MGGIVCCQVGVIDHGVIRMTEGRLTEVRVPQNVHHLALGVSFFSSKSRRAEPIWAGFAPAAALSQALLWGTRFNPVYTNHLAS